MKKAFILLLLLSHLAIATEGRRVDMFPFKSFAWRQVSVTTLNELYNEMRKIKDQETATLFRQAIEVTNKNAEFYLGYALGEFRNVRERRIAEQVFAVQHPFLGSTVESMKLSPSKKILLGYISGSGMSRLQIANIRKALFSLPEAAVYDVFYTLERSNWWVSRLDENDVLQVIREKTASACKTEFKKPKN